MKVKIVSDMFELVLNEHAYTYTLKIIESNSKTGIQEILIFQPKKFDELVSFINHYPFSIIIEHPSIQIDNPQVIITEPEIMFIKEKKF